MALLLHPYEAAMVVGVTPQTLRVWVRAGLLTERRTAGGHLRYSKEEILDLCGGDLSVADEPAIPYDSSFDKDYSDGGTASGADVVTLADLFKKCDGEDVFK